MGLVKSAPCKYKKYKYLFLLLKLFVQLYLTDCLNCKSDL